MTTYKERLIAKLVQTKPGSLILTCAVGAAVVSISIGTLIYALYNEAKEN